MEANQPAEPAAHGALADSFELPVNVPQAEFTVRHPASGAATAARITLAGPVHAIRTAAMFARLREKQAEFARTGKIDPGDPADNDQDEIAFMATCTLGWTGLRLDGKALPFAIGTPQQLYSDPRFQWLRDQVRDALEDRVLFISA